MAEKQLTDEVRAALEAQASGLPPGVAEAKAEQAEEWGQWVATQQIFYGGALAANVGDSVPAANVKQYRYDQLGWVAKRGTKAAGEAATVTEPAPADTTGTQGKVN
ncbi:MAG: hypothetical protein ACRDUA_23390 [Micromonosporaceae bacterium]